MEMPRGVFTTFMDENRRLYLQWGFREAMAIHEVWFLSIDSDGKSFQLKRTGEKCLADLRNRSAFLLCSTQPFRI
jgi:hypothetical protein